ncbi:MAG: alcohol dehydrogenase-related protein [Candidatus Rokubacteria bacterium CSP1-6]|nr:MAG: alcohol dehydrogenase-related protein [Candidatus Rokubacteria bacterium CSP1-6]
MRAMKASILPDRNAPLVVEEVTLDAPKTCEVLVRIAACGVCHSDLSVIDGTLPLPTPIVLGHEGAGVVEAVGPGVTSVKAGDHVVLSWRPGCNRCPYCLRGQPYLCDLASRMSLSGAMLDEMVTRTYKVSEVNQAFDDLRNGVNLRGVLIFS